MKIILLILIGLSITLGISFAEPQLEYQQPYDFSEWVMIGNITSVEILSKPSSDDFSSRAGVALYTLDVEKYLKNPIENSTFTVPGYYHNQKELGRHSLSQLYEIDQRVLFYVQELKHMPGHDYIVRDRISGFLIDSLCPETTTFDKGLCFSDDDPNEAHATCVNDSIEHCQENVLSLERITNCGTGTDMVNGICTPLCGPGTKLVNGACNIERVIESRISIGSDGSPLPFIGLMGLMFGVIGIVAFVIHRREDN